MSKDVPNLEIVRVEGIAHPPFEPLADVFARVVAEQRIGGAALCIYRDGRPLVDLVGGTYKQDSLQLLFSVSKGVVAIAAALAHREGLIDLDAPLGDCWPAFRRRSTARITARSALSHRAGLPAVDEPLSIDDLLAGRLEEALERQEPYWEPGTAHGYHGLTVGPLVDGVFVRLLGRDLGSFIDERLAKPLGLHLWLGAPPGQRHRVAPVLSQGIAVTPLQAEGWWGRDNVKDAALLGFLADPTVFNRPELLAACWPAAMVVAGARDLARLYAATLGPVDGVRLLDERALADLTASRSRGRDRILHELTHFGSGVQLPFPRLPYLGPASYGHDGAGGSLAFADREHGVAVGFTTDVLPRVGGASVGVLTLVSTLRHCLTERWG